MTLNDRITEAKKSNDGRPHVPEGDAGTTVFISQMDKIIKKNLQQPQSALFAMLSLRSIIAHLPLSCTLPTTHCIVSRSTTSSAPNSS